METVRLLPSQSRVRTDAPRSAWGDGLELVKFRLSGLVVVTATLGYLLAVPGVPDLATLFATAVGTFLLSGGASAANQWMEVARDARMRRTANRPLPAGRVAPGCVLLYSVVLVSGGFALLLAGAGILPAGLGAVTVIIYLALYTPLKRITTLNTLVGALVGALPPMMGWAAATGGLGSGAFVLASILFLWQIPHFLAIAWLHRDDYRRGGFRMLPHSDPDGRITALATVLYSIALIPATLAAAAIRPTGWLYPAVAGALGIGFFLLAVRFSKERSRSAARSLFLASLVYLPVVLLVLVLDPTGPVGAFR